MEENASTIGIILIDLLVAIALITSMRKLSGILANVSSTTELASRDNYAFGISFAGTVVALAIMLTGVVSGDAASSGGEELLLVISYGLLGMLLMVITGRFIDRFLLPNIDMREEILKGNMAVAIVEVGNILATAMIVRAAMLWVESMSLLGLFAVLWGYVVSQLVITLVTKYRVFVYRKRHSGGDIQEAFKEGNCAIALRYLGNKVGAALAVTASTGLIIYDGDNVFLLVLLWGLTSILLTALLFALAIAARWLILAKIDVVNEVDHEKNIGVGMIEATIYIAMGLLLSALLM